MYLLRIYNREKDASVIVPTEKKVEECGRFLNSIGVDWWASEIKMEGMLTWLKLKLQS